MSDDELKFKLLRRDCLCRTHLVSCVRTPPETLQKTPPIAAPAEKVENAMGRKGPGGNAFARIPKLVGALKVRTCKRTSQEDGSLRRLGSEQREPNLVSLAVYQASYQLCVSTCEDYAAYDRTEPNWTTAHTWGEASTDRKHRQNGVSS
jgi:hypothetical protein